MVVEASSTKTPWSCARNHCQNSDTFLIWPFLDRTATWAYHLPVEQLKKKLRHIHRRGYKAYLELKGKYEFDEFTLFIDHVQGDPFASPSRVRVRVPHAVSGFTNELFLNEARRLGFEDFLRRQFFSSIARYGGGLKGTGKSGLIHIHGPGQEMVKTSAILATHEYIEARIFVGLPAQGRTILGTIAEQMFCAELPQIVHASLIQNSLDRTLLAKWMALAEDVEHIRQLLPQKGLIAFLRNGSILPRRSGIDQRPMNGAIPFRSPENLEVTFTTPNHGVISGMGIPEGVTLIVGGGYHGKSTLLRAIERGVYIHIPGDGREWVVTDPTAIKIRAEDGRRVEKVDISPFISDLPMGKSTQEFCTDDASGSTSQAANIVEALELGSRLLLIDEDTSATNFMIRDRRMQKLVRREKEPITPFIDQVRNVLENGVSTILVMGGAGDYLDVADLVLMMDTYVPRDVTSLASRIVQDYPTGRLPEAPGPFRSPIPRVPLPPSIDPTRGKKPVKIDAKSIHTILFGRIPIDLSSVEQLVDIGQTRAIGDAIHYLKEHHLDGRRSMIDAIELFHAALKTRGLDILSPSPRGDYVMPRPMELGFAINRLRSLKVR